MNKKPGQLGKLVSHTQQMSISQGTEAQHKRKHADDDETDQPCKRQLGASIEFNQGPASTSILPQKINQGSPSTPKIRPNIAPSTQSSLITVEKQAKNTNRINNNKPDDMPAKRATIPKAPAPEDRYKMSENKKKTPTLAVSPPSTPVTQVTSKTFKTPMSPPETPLVQDAPATPTAMMIKSPAPVSTSSTVPASHEANRSLREVSTVLCSTAITTTTFGTTQNHYQRTRDIAIAANSVLGGNIAAMGDLAASMELLRSWLTPSEAESFLQHIDIARVLKDKSQLIQDRVDLQRRVLKSSGMKPAKSP